MIPKLVWRAPMCDHALREAAGLALRGRVRARVARVFSGDARPPARTRRVRPTRTECQTSGPTASDGRRRRPPVDAGPIAPSVRTARPGQPSHCPRTVNPLERPSAGAIPVWRAVARRQDVGPRAQPDRRWRNPLPSSFPDARRPPNGRRRSRGVQKKHSFRLRRRRYAPNQTLTWRRGSPKT